MQTTRKFVSRDQPRSTCNGAKSKARSPTNGAQGGGRAIGQWGRSSPTSLSAAGTATTGVTIVISAWSYCGVLSMDKLRPAALSKRNPTRRVISCRCMPLRRVAVHRGKQGGSTMNIRPDPTFHASPKLAMEAPPENFAYTVLLSPDFSKPDALAVIDVNPSSQNYCQVVHTVTMPNKGDEFHHFGWNACSSALSPLTGHAFVERRYLIIPGIRSSRIYVIDTKPDPTE